MGAISILPEHIVNRIAAGEVIERPGSVVKELVENSLDAEATMISVSVRHGGKSLIKVMDNGLGMDRQDAELCFKNHATSKIKNPEDIFTIGTMGFRGEALSSIAAVSRATMCTRSSAYQIGAEIEAIAGSIKSINDKGTPAGTTLEVADLFFNTPARKKFLKSDKAEYTYIAEVMTTISLAYPHVAFKLYKDGNLIFDYPHASDLKERLLATHYREWVNYLVPIEESSEGMTLRGYIGKAELSRINRTGQLFFINKRPIKSVSLSYALNTAYQGLLPHKHFPVAILFFDIDPTAVDVNVHPTKREVRLQNERDIQERVIKCVKETLGKADHSFKVSFSYSLDKRKTYSPQSNPAPLDFKEVQKRIAEEVHYPETPQDASSHQVVEEQQEPLWGEKGKAFKVFSLLGQIRGSYIVAETEQGLVIFDQHAAHERIVFEKIMETFEEDPVQPQPLLIPVMLELSFKETQLLESYLNFLTAVGFSITPLGNTTFSVDAVPAWLEGGEVKNALQQFLDEAGRGKGSFKEKREHAAKLLACKSHTVKMHQKLTSEEMEHLINDLEKTKNPFTCPHGRPTLIKVTIDDLERHFKRR